MFHRGKSGAVDLIHASVSINDETVAKLQSALEPCLQVAGRPMAVLDLAGVELIDSRGLEEITDQHRLFIERGGDLKLSAPLPLVEDILEITGIADTIDIFENANSAVGSFSH
ncbi:MAG: STAS domain-containing protein [Planctomycetales bacterium]|nr:STAS domain-containing protein [Planctomycetales bacterium]